MYVLREFDPWKNPLCTCPPKYSLHPYTGCSFKCIYCYTISYIKASQSTPKRNFINRLIRDLRKANPQYPITISNSSDPYPPIELTLKLTRRTLELLLPRGYKVQIITKSILVVRDVDILSKYNAAVSLTITTLKDSIAKIIEPYAPLPRLRLRAIEKLVKNKIPVAVRVDPLIPYVNDDPYDISKLIKFLANLGVQHIITSTYKVKPDNFKRVCSALPNIRDKLRELYYMRGEYKHGYRYLPKKLRRELLKIVIDEAKIYGLTCSTCREGFPEFQNAPTCDGTHLIPERINTSLAGVTLWSEYL